MNDEPSCCKTCRQQMLLCEKCNSIECGCERCECFPRKRTSPGRWVLRILVAGLVCILLGYTVGEGLAKLVGSIWALILMAIYMKEQSLTKAETRGSVNEALRRGNSYLYADRHKRIVSRTEED